MKRLLIISNNPLSPETNNGQMLLSNLARYSPKCLANFFIADSFPTNQYCSTFFRITDREVLRLGIFKNLGQTLEPRKDGIPTLSVSKKRRTSLTMLGRHFLWTLAHPIGRKLLSWAQSFRPDAILLQIGDSPFVIDAAVKLVKKIGVPLIVYNTENYYIKRHDFIDQKIRRSLWFLLFFHFLKRSYKKVSDATWIHLTPEIEKEYRTAFPNAKHHSIASSYSLLPMAYVPQSNRFSLCYFGNFGLGRYEQLLGIGRICEKINPQIQIHFFGNLSAEQKDNLAHFNNIVYHGFAHLDSIWAFCAANVDLLLHTESFSEYSKIDLVDSFSTKVANCLNSGLPFLCYLPGSLNLSNYLKRTDACFVCNSEKELSDSLAMAYKNTTYRMSKIPNALLVAKNNHSPDANALHFKKIIDETIENNQIFNIVK